MGAWGCYDSLQLALGWSASTCSSAWRPATTAAAAPESDSSPADMVGPIQSTPREDVPSALRDRFHSDHPEPLVDVSEIQGVVPADVIPALEDPGFEPAAEVGWLAPVEPVLALEINGDARAYPLRIMTWHELVNGTVGGVPSKIRSIIGGIGLRLAPI